MSFEPFNTPYEKEAYLMLFSAENLSGSLFVQAGDLALLANDIKAVAGDVPNESETEENIAFDAAHILLIRVGGFRNLESYMRCLRVKVA